MKKIPQFLLLLACLLGFASQSLACNLSDFTLGSVSYDPQNQEWVINTVLRIGGGVTGTVKGADGDTRSVSFGFYKGCMPLTINSFFPATLPSPYSSCANPGSNLGPQGAPFNSQATILYIDPGYYGTFPCVTSPLACITSTNNCGNVALTSYNVTFRTDNLPDSIRVFGVEGGGNPQGGCYNVPDMLIDFCLLGYCTPNITCPPQQQVYADANCQAVLPTYGGIAGISYNCAAPSPATISQAPAAGATISGPGLTAVVLTALFPNSQTASCTFQVAMVDTLGPNLTCPPNQTQGYNTQCQFESYNYSGLVTVTDNCSPSPTVTQSPAIGTIFPSAGTQTITVTATDNVGNSSMCTFDVTYVAPVPVLTQVGNQMCTTGFATYQWYFNGTLIPGATDSCTIITMTGTYTVVAADSNGCMRQSGPTTVVSIDPGQATTFSLSPIPARDFVKLELSQPLDQPGELLVYNLAGKVVAHRLWSRLEAETIVSLEGIASGSYLIELRSAGMQGIKKLLVLQ